MRLKRISNGPFLGLCLCITDLGITGLGVLSALGAFGWASPHLLASDAPLNEIPGKISEAECEIWDDPHGVPHLRVSQTTETELKGLACLGFLHARDRSWQMDFFRRTSQGKSAEILGRHFIKTDYFMRLLGLTEKAESLFHGMSLEEQKLLWAYSWGVNQGMSYALKNRLDGTYEFFDLEYGPEPWHPIHTLGLILLQSFDQTKRSFEIQLGAFNPSNPSASSTSAEDFQKLIQEMTTEETGEKVVYPWETTILKEGEYPQVQAAPGSSHPLTQAQANPFLNTFPSVSAGSNNWVVNPSRSQTGHAWLANDPHLSLGHPPFWHWAHWVVGDVDAIGAFFPGVPMMVSGANREVSWGLTNSYLPAAHVSLVNEKDLTTASVTRPWIWVKVWKFKLPFFFKTYRRLKGLPILPLPAPQGKAIILRWTGLNLLPHEIMGYYRVMKAHSSQEVDRELSTAGVSGWNFVFADSSGLIGYRAAGRSARFERTAPDLSQANHANSGTDAETVAEGELSQQDLDHAFEKPLGPDQMPHVFNPRRGYVATANNHQWPNNAKWNLGHAQLSGFRAFRIEEMILKTEQHNLDSFQKIQCDIQAVDARFLLPLLLHELENPTEIGGAGSALDQQAIRLLKGWDLETRVDCLPCGLYRRWVDHLLEAAGIGIQELYQVLKSSALNKTNSKPVSDWIWTAFREAQKDLTFAENSSPQSWGKIHQSSFEHLAGDDFFGKQVQGDLLEIPGDAYTVNLGDSKWNGKSFQVKSGPSERVIVEMSKPPKVYSVLAGPNRDLPLRFLSDPKGPWKKWLSCEQQQMLFPIEWSRLPSPSSKIRLGSIRIEN